MVDEKALAVEKFDLSVSADGMHILMMFGGSGAEAGLVIPHEKAMQLMGLILEAVGQAADRRNSTSNMKFALHVKRWEFKHPSDSDIVTLSYTLQNDMIISFQVPRQVSAQMRDGLTALLDIDRQIPAPETLLN